LKMADFRAVAAFSAPLLPILFAVLVKASIIVAGMFAFSPALRNARPGPRHVVWLCTIGSGLLVLLLAFTGPLFHVNGRPGVGESHDALSRVSSTLLPSAGSFARSLQPRLVSQGMRQPATGHGGRDLLATAVMMAWIGGALAGWSRILWSRVRLVRLAGRGKTADHYGRLVRELSPLVGIRKKVRVVESGKCVTSLAMGLLRPVILLPPGLRQWSAAAQRAVLLHELIHLKRRDSCTLALAYATCSLLWFVPPIWAAYARLSLEQEKACDAAVVEKGVARHDYAACILEAARSCGRAVVFAGPGYSAGRRGILVDRIQSIVGAGNAVKKGVAVACCAGLLLGAMTLLGAAGKTRYVAKPHEEHEGTWTSQRAEFQKVVVFPGGARMYTLVSDSEPKLEVRDEIFSKWTDPQGNAWYKTYRTVVAGRYRGLKIQVLARISGSGNHNDSEAFIVSEFDPETFPSQVIPGDPCYAAYERAAP
jgi:beta-lactamase regulating signal transducer with metallopeptidase domain